MPMASQETPTGTDQPSDRLRVRMKHPAGTIKQTPAGRRYTPYRKTPATRQMHSEVRVKLPKPTSKKKSGGRGKKDTGETESAYTPIVDMLKKTWKVYKLSPMYKFSYSPKDLRSYGRLLNAYIAAETRKGLAVNPEDIPNKAAVTELKGFKQNDNDSEAIRIVLKSSDKGEEREILVAIICSVDMDMSFINKSELKDFTTLPLMLLKGSVAICHHFTSWLQVQFDSKASKLAVTPLSLTWMLAMWAGYTLEGTRMSKTVRLVYRVPAEVAGLQRILFDIDAKDCHQLWECIHHVEEDESNIIFSQEEVVNFIKSLEEHFYHHMKIKLSKMHLSQFGTPAVTMDLEGRLKMYSLGHCLQVLAHLTQLAAEQALNVP